MIQWIYVLRRRYGIPGVVSTKKAIFSDDCFSEVCTESMIVREIGTNPQTSNSVYLNISENQKILIQRNQRYSENREKSNSGSRIISKKSVPIRIWEPRVSASRYWINQCLDILEISTQKSKDFDTYSTNPLLPRGFLLLFPHFPYTLCAKITILFFKSHKTTLGDLISFPLLLFYEA